MAVPPGDEHFQLGLKIYNEQVDKYCEKGLIDKETMDKFAQALDCFRQAIRYEHTRAIFYIGMCHHYGLGVENNSRKALIHYRSAALKGHREAQYNLACYLWDGEGVPQNYQEAFHWFHKSAIQGYADAQFEVALSYTLGEGVDKDERTAAHFYTLAAFQGHLSAKHNLGCFYREGFGIEKNLEKAKKLFEEASQGGEPYAMYSLGEYYERLSIPPDLKLAVKWYQKAAQNENDMAKKKLEALRRQGLTSPFSSPNTAVLSCGVGGVEMKHNGDSSSKPGQASPNPMPAWLPSIDIPKSPAPQPIAMPSLALIRSGDFSPVDHSGIERPAAPPPLAHS